MLESYDQQFLLYFSTSKKIGLLDAVLEIDECIKKISASTNINYDVIYQTIFSFDYLTEFIKNKEKTQKSKRLNIDILQTEGKKLKESKKIEEYKCESLTLKQCEESDKCFYLEEYGCLPRKIKDYEEINRDPDKYITKNIHTTADLRKLVHIAAYLYHNYDSGGLTDNSYDALEHALKKKEKLKGKLYEKIGAPPVDKIKTKLPWIMPSLTKVKPGEKGLTKFLGYFDDKNLNFCAWSLKLDGVSLEVVYVNGEISKLYTRGDGIIGGNVSYLKDFINIPKIIGESIVNKNLVVRGELVIQKEVWATKYKTSYSNARSFISAKVNTGFISSGLQDIRFVAYEIMRINPNIKEEMLPSRSQMCKILYSENFEVVENGVLISPTTFQIADLYRKKRIESEYYIDGIVLAVDGTYDSIKHSSYYNGTEVFVNNDYIVAFKMLLEEQIRDTKVIDVDWRITRYGRYFPVVVYESVYIEGVRLTRATGHSARRISDWNMGVGTKIKVVRSGDVIPQIKDVIVDAKIQPIFPKSFDDGGYEWHWEKSNIILDEIETNREVQIKRCLYFFETLGIPRLGPKTIEKLYDAGFTLPESIVSASISDLASIKDIGLKSATGFYNTIRETISKTPPDRFMVASTNFQSGVGRKLLKQLFKEIPNILDYSEQRIRDYFRSHKMPGFGPTRIENIAIGVPKFREYLDSFAESDVRKAIDYYVNKLKEMAINGYNKKIYKNKFVITGLKSKETKSKKTMSGLDFNLEDYIYENYGDFSDVVTSDVSAVIAGNVTNLSKKIIAASELGITILTLDEFIKRFDIPIKITKTKTAY